jgi:NitT/TauT family transport system substrate-binding protein
MSLELYCTVKLRKTLSAVLTASIFAFGAHMASAAEKMQMVTSSTGLLYATSYIAKHMGYFEEEGLDVTITDGSGGSNAVAAVVGGSADIGDVGIRNVSQAIERGVGMKVIATGINAFPATLVVNSDFAKNAGVTESSTLTERMAALKGGTVAVTDIGGASGGFVRYLLKQAGLPEDYVTLINLNSNAGQLASLKAGRIDGFVNTSPTTETAIAEGYGFDMVVPSRDMPDIKDMHFIIIAVREDYLNENRENVHKLLRGIRRAQLLVQNESETAKDAFFGYMDSLSSATPTPDNVKDLIWQLNRTAIPAGLALSDTGVTKARKFFKINAAVTDEMLVDNSLASAVEDELR